MISQTVRRLFRFAVVGTIVAACYVVFYLGLIKFGFSQPVANAVAFLCAVAIQYLGQTLWTFEQPLNTPGQITRFICTIGLGLLISALITGLLGPALGWADWVSAIFVTVVLPVQNYLIFKSWVYQNPKKLFGALMTHIYSDQFFDYIDAGGAIFCATDDRARAAFAWNKKRSGSGQWPWCLAS